LFKVDHPLSRLRSLAGTLVLFLSCFLLTACILTANQSIEGDPKDPRAQDIADKVRSIDLLPRQTTDAGSTAVAEQSSSRPAIYLSDGSAPQGSAAIEREDTGSGSGYDLNFENAPVATVAKVILGDVLGVGYSIDPRVQGTVTLASVRPVAKADALYVLENALRMSGVSLVRDRNGYRLLPANEAGPAAAAPTGPSRSTPSSVSTPTGCADNRSASSRCTTRRPSRSSARSRRSWMPARAASPRTSSSSSRSAGSMPFSWSARNPNISSAPEPGSRGSTNPTPTASI
jgi:hypothetical protein